MSILLVKSRSIDRRTWPMEARDVMSAATPLNFGICSKGVLAVRCRAKTVWERVSKLWADWGEE
jgi:hypothetical protein